MTTSQMQFGPAVESDLEAAGAVLSRAFGMSAEQAATWMIEKVTLEETRVLREHGAVVATSMRVPMGIWLGGASVPQVGIAGVAVAPEARGRGLARDIMRRCIREMHERGETISTLYSAMHPLYRGVGYDVAGQLFSARVPAGMLVSGDRGADWRPMTDADRSGVEACARERARCTSGALDRGPYVWDRVFNPKDGPVEAFVAERDGGEIEAYCVYRVHPRTDGPTSGNARGKVMDLTDFGYSSGQGLQRLLGFLRGFSSTVGEIDLADHPGSPLLASLPDRRFAASLHDPWMLRVVDVAGALRVRGYHKAVSCAFVLHVRDGLIESNRVPMRVRIAGGEAEVEDTPEADTRDAVTFDVRHLAPLITGMQSARQLSKLGLVSGPQASIEAIDAAFACAGGPCMFDFF